MYAQKFPWAPRGACAPSQQARAFRTSGAKKLRKQTACPTKKKHSKHNSHALPCRVSGGLGIRVWHFPCRAYRVYMGFRHGDYGFRVQSSTGTLPFFTAVRLRRHASGRPCRQQVRRGLRSPDLEAERAVTTRGPMSAHVRAERRLPERAAPLRMTEERTEPARCGCNPHGCAQLWDVLL